MRRALLLVLLAIACRRPAHTDGDGDDLPDPRPNIIVFLADDMRHDALFAMPTVEAELGDRGARFTRAYVTTPMCCPSRASFLSGGFYAHDTGVLTNEAPNGGASSFVDADTLPTRLQAAGYATGYLGKYLNHYDELGPYVPPGWTAFRGLSESRTYHGWVAQVGSSGAAAGVSTPESGSAYVTDWQRDEALAFVEEHADEPFFLLFGALAPHAPWEPDPADADAFVGLEWRAGAFNEPDVEDKPLEAQRPRWPDARVADADVEVQQQLATLRSLDRAVGDVLARLDTLGIADRTVVVFTSDNGYLWGEHRIQGKGWAYEESVRVPLIVRSPGAAPTTNDRLVAGDLDLAATIADLAGLAPRGSGSSLRPLVAGEDPAWRPALLLEGFSLGPPRFSAAVTPEHKLIRHDDGAVERYDLLADPYEEEALSDVPAELAWLDAWLEARRGSMLADATILARLGEPVDVQLTSVGGVTPYTWNSDAWPRGLTMSRAGRVTGAAEEPGSWDVAVDVRDSSISPYHGGPQRSGGTVHVTVGASSRALLAPTEVTRSGRAARLIVHVRPGARVEVAHSPDPTFDEAVYIGPLAAAPDSGRVAIGLEGLVPDRAWRYRVRVDGIVAEIGRIPP